MHKKLLFLLMSVMLLTVGCNKGPKNLSDMKDATAADSMMYYFGQMQAYNYWQDAESDTLLRSESARQEFMKGFRATLGMEGDESAYNKGLQLGLRLALRVKEFEKRYGVKLPEDVLAASLEYALQNDSVDVGEAQMGFYKIKDKLEFRAANKELTGAKKNLDKDAREKGFTQLSDTLYYKDLTPGSGPKFKIGDRLAIEISVATIDGKDVVTRQFPDSITLGEGRIPSIVREAVQTMNSGQTRQFMTTPRSLLGKRYAVYNLPYDQPVIFTVNVHGRP